jgi:hypothetical protein
MSQLNMTPELRPADTYTRVRVECHSLLRDRDTANSACRLGHAYYGQSPFNAAHTVDLITIQLASYDLIGR